MIVRLGLAPLPDPEGGLPAFHLVSEHPEEDLARLLCRRLEVRVSPGPAGLRLGVEVHGSGLLEAGLDLDPATALRLADELDGGYLLVLDDARDPAWPVHVFEPPPAAWLRDDLRELARPGVEPEDPGPDASPGRIAERVARLGAEGRVEAAHRRLQAAQARHGEEPRLLTETGRLLALEGRRVDACSRFHRALELDPNLLPALVCLALWEPDRLVAEAALARARAIDPGDPRVESAVRSARGEGGQAGPGATGTGGGPGAGPGNGGDPQAEAVDLRLPFRYQWHGARASRAGRRDPLSPEAAFESFLEAAVADGRVEPWEEDLLVRLARLLGLDAAARRAALERVAGARAARQAAENGGKDQGGSADSPGIAGGPSRPLDRTEVFRRLAAAAVADGEIEPEELTLLETCRELLEVPAEVALEAVLTAGERERASYPVVAALLAAPLDRRAVHRFRGFFFLGSATLRPGLAQALATVLDQLRATSPGALPGVLPPLAEVGRYSRRLRTSVARAVTTMVGLGAQGRAAAWALARANPGCKAVVEALAEGLVAAAEADGDPTRAVRELQALSLLRPGTGKVEAALTRLMAPTSPVAGDPGGAGAPDGSFQARISAIRERLARAAARGAKLEVLEALDAAEGLLEQAPELSEVVAACRVEAALAASYHAWLDLLEVVASSSSSHGGAYGSDSRVDPRARAAVLLAGAECACRQGRDPGDFVASLSRLEAEPGLPDALRARIARALERYRPGSSPAS